MSCASWSAHTALFSLTELCAAVRLGWVLPAAEHSEGFLSQKFQPGLHKSTLEFYIEGPGRSKKGLRHFYGFSAHAVRQTSLPQLRGRRMEVGHSGPLPSGLMHFSPLCPSVEEEAQARSPYSLLFWLDHGSLMVRKLSLHEVSGLILSSDLGSEMQQTGFTLWWERAGILMPS